MDQTLSRIPGVSIAEVVAVSSDGAPILRWGCGPVRRRRAMSTWRLDQPDWHECIGLRVVVGFEDGDEQYPIVLGLLDAPLRTPEPSRPRRLRIESGQELVIECGKAKIEMRADGRIEIRGGHLISRSSGPNKIKGGSVDIN